MNAWTVTVIDEPDRGAALVFADTMNKARGIGCASLGEPYINVTAALTEVPIPGDGIEREAKSREYRAAGWHEEGEPTCAECGKSSYGFDEYKVCLDCGYCRECVPAVDGDGALDEEERCECWTPALDSLPTPEQRNG